MIEWNIVNTYLLAAAVTSLGLIVLYYFVFFKK